MVLKFSARTPDRRCVGLPCAKPVAFQARVLRSLDQLPAFSPIINRLLANLAKEHVSFAELAELIEKDTVLSGNLLRTVNSALYSLRGTVSSVSHAIAIMGLTRLRNMVLTASLARMWRRFPVTRGWSEAAFNLHSAATASLADLIVQRLPVTYPEGAFTAGLFHDFGKLLTASTAPEEYEMLSSQCEGGSGELEAREREALGITHGELASMALARWNLPLPIQRAVEHHHVPENIDGWRRPPSEIIRTADRCVNLMGITVAPVTSVEVSSPEQVLADLGIDDGVPKLLEEFSGELTLLRNFF